MDIVFGVLLFVVAAFIAASGVPPPTAGAMTIQLVPVEPPQLSSNVATWLLAIVLVLFILAMVLP